MATQKRGVSNAVTSKSFQPKYNDCSSIWGLKHLESFQNNYFLTLADHFKQERTVSLVLTDGISIFRPEAWKSLVISKDSSAIIFDAAFVLKENQNIDPVMQIKVDANVTQNLHVGIWWNQPGNGFYVTSSPSRGLTTVGQGAVDFLTASAIFADVVREVTREQLGDRHRLRVRGAEQVAGGELVPGEPPLEGEGPEVHGTRRLRLLVRCGGGPRSGRTRG